MAVSFGAAMCQSFETATRCPRRGGLFFPPSRVYRLLAGIFGLCTTGLPGPDLFAPSLGALFQIFVPLCGGYSYEMAHPRVFQPPVRDFALYKPDRASKQLPDLRNC